MSKTQPRVSVVTPIYNGEQYLARCIDTVLAQSHSNFEYLLLNNASTDGTQDIIDDYAARDERIRPLRNDTVLPQIPNWNVSMAAIGADSVYCKVLHADDELLPGCLEQMVAVGERHPRAVIIGAYRIDGPTVNMASIPYPTELVDGRELCRKRLLGQWQDLFGSPSSIMYRADAVRARGERFFGLDNAHADTEVCFELLKDGDYGFVHQTLTYTRRHEATETAGLGHRASHCRGRVLIARDHGADFLSAAEHRRAMRLQLGYYDSIVAANPEWLKDASFRAEAQALYRSCGARLNYARIAALAARRGTHVLARTVKRALS